MIPEELQDYVVYSEHYDGYAYWGRNQKGELDWCLVKQSAHGYPFSKPEADVVCEKLAQKYGGFFRAVPREKSDLVCVKAV